MTAQLDEIASFELLSLITLVAVRDAWKGDKDAVAFLDESMSDWRERTAHWRRPSLGRCRNLWSDKPSE